MYLITLRKYRQKYLILTKYLNQQKMITVSRYNPSSVTMREQRPDDENNKPKLKIPTKVLRMWCSRFYTKTKVLKTP